MRLEPSLGRVQLAPIWLVVWLLGVAGSGLAIVALTIFSADPVWLRVANGTVPAFVGSACAWAGYRTVRRQPAVLWTPLPWFLAAWAIYYGFGPLVYVYGTPDSVAYMDSFYPVDQTTLLRTNALNLVALPAVVGGIKLFAHLRIAGASWRRPTTPHGPWRVAGLFLAIGVPIKYLFELPYVLGLVDFVLPGAIQYLGTFSGLAIIPLSVAASEGRRGAGFALWALVLSELAVGMVMLAKLHIIKTVLLVLLGQYAVRQNLRSLILAALTIAVAYVVVLSPFVNFARIMLGRASAQDITEAASAVQAFGAEGREALADALPGVQAWWTRLAYPNAQAFAMAEYDGDRPGWTFAMAAYVFLPRFLYDEKPIMTPGIEFTRLIQGTDTSSTGLGFAGEAYWNGGWPLVIGTGLVVGGLFAVLGRLSITAISTRRWLLVPLVFQAIYLGLRPDDWFVPAYIGGVLQVLVVVGLLHLIAGRFVAQPRGLARSKRGVSFTSTRTLEGLRGRGAVQ